MYVVYEFICIVCIVFSLIFFLFTYNKYLLSLKRCAVSLVNIYIFFNFRGVDYIYRVIKVVLYYYHDICTFHHFLII